MRRRRLLALLPATLAGCGEAREAVAPLDPRRRPAGPTDGGSGADDPGAGTARATGTRTRTPAADPFDVVVTNDDPVRHLVTVVVERAGGTGGDDGGGDGAAGTEAFVATRAVESGTAVRFRGAVGPGRYRVVVETAAGDRVERRWRAADPFRELSVRVDDGVAVRRVARCSPDCPGVSRGGESTGYPDGGFDPRGRRAGSALRLVNDVDDARRVAVAVDGLLSYAYDVPPGTVLEVPVPQRSDPREVRVETPDGRVTHPWRMEATPKLRVDVGGRPTVSCGPGSLDLQALNDDGDPHDLAVRVVAGGVTEYRLSLSPGETVRLRDVVDTAGSYALVLETAAATTGFRWTTCPTRGPVQVVVRPDGVPVAPSLPRTSSGPPA